MCEGLARGWHCVYFRWFQQRQSGSNGDQQETMVAGATTRPAEHYREHRSAAAESCSQVENGAHFKTVEHGMRTCDLHARTQTCNPGMISIAIV